MSRQLKVSIVLESIAQTQGFQRFNQEMRGVQATVKKIQPALDAAKFAFKTSAAAVGIAGGAVAIAAKAAMNYASNTADMASAAGVSTDAIQALGFVARNNGAKVEDMSKALIQLQSSAADAARGNDAAREKFARLGISAESFARLKPEAQMERFARAVANSQNQQEALAAAMDIIGGKNAPKLMAAIRELADKGFKILGQEAAAAGQIMSAKTVTDLDRAGDRIEEFKNRAIIAFGEIAGKAVEVWGPADEVGRAAQALALAEKQSGKDGLGAAKARLAYADALSKVGRAEEARVEFLRTMRSAPERFGAGIGSEYASRRAAVASSISRAIAAAAKIRKEAEQRASENASADAAEAEGIRFERRRKFYAELDQQNADARAKYEDEARKRAYDRDQKGYEDRLAVAERYQDALAGVLNRDVNDYQRRGLQLGAMRDPFSLPSVQLPASNSFQFDTSAAIAAAKTPSNNAGREDNASRSLLQSINSGIQQLVRKETALA